jgi:hypothetical protein
MKNLILLLVVLVSSLSFSQQIEKRKSKYYVNGSQIATYEAKNLIKNNPEAYKYFKAGKDKEAIGGLLLGGGIALTVADLLNAANSDIDYPNGLTYVGIGAMAISIPVLIGRTKKVNKAVEIYNEGLKKIGYNTTEYSIINNKNGIGLQIKF